MASPTAKTEITCQLEQQLLNAFVDATITAPGFSHNMFELNLNVLADTDFWG